ncbi:glycosyltransferase family 1 protein [Persicobacter psychrovividus]|uniref:Glycosyltransferase involved in cell wall biosynthesis n=1 Tax=Persicobacter psychrovividus TaxID=387638 RepID=A0ABM7VCJ2_9BACT|nr:hypothetical protein PEPS_08930 [Persicobacter psychrovividus]
MDVFLGSEEYIEMGGLVSPVFLFRAKRAGGNSIEELFSTIVGGLNNPAKVVNIPHVGASFKALFKNIIFGKRLKGQVFHITGDVQYMALGTGRNTVLTVHDVGSALQGNVLKWFLIKLLWFWLPSLIVRKITVISEFSKGELLEIIPWARHKVQVIPNPVDYERCMIYTRQEPTKFTLLLVGTKPNKNLEKTIEALKGLDVHLNIIGSLTEVQQSLLTATHLTFDNYVNISYDEVLGLYARSSLLCFASTYEGFGMPIIEAQAIGIPVITSNVASMPEVAGDSAILVDPLNVGEIREAVLLVKNNPSKAQELVAKGRVNVERFKLANIVAQYEAVYEEVYNGKA